MMRRTPGLVALLVLLATLSLPTSNASGSTTNACAYLAHKNTATSKSAYYRSGATNVAANLGCGSTAYELAEGACITLQNTYAADAGIQPPPKATTIRVYWYFGTSDTDHGNAGTTWAGYLTSFTYDESGGSTAFEDANPVVCATRDGTALSVGVPGTYRLVLRASGSGFDINNDMNPTCNCNGSPGTGNTANGTYPLLATVARADDPMKLSAAYSWDTHKARVAVALSFTNGTARSGAANSITVRIYDPDGTSVASGNPTAVEDGGYVYAVSLGIAPYFGVYTAYADVLQPGSATDHVTGYTTFVVTENLTGKLADLRAFLLDFEANMNASQQARMVYLSERQNTTTAEIRTQLDGLTSYLATRGNTTSTETQALLLSVQAYLSGELNQTATASLLLTVQDYLATNTNTSDEVTRLLLLNVQTTLWDALNASQEAQTSALSLRIGEAQHEIQDALNATTNATVNLTPVLNAVANLTSEIENASYAPTPGAAMIVTGEPAPDAGVYVGKPARFAANVTPAAYGALTFLWDFGDNATAVGAVAYHTYAKNGTYPVRLLVTSGMGLTNETTTNVTANLSTPLPIITGPANATQLYLSSYDASGSTDPHDTITAYAWEVDPGDVEVPFVGTRHFNKGYGNAATFNYVWPQVGEGHRLVLTVTNSHGVTNTTTLEVRVGSPIIPTPGAPLPHHANGMPNPNPGVKQGVGVVEGLLHFFAKLLTGNL